MYAPPLFDFGSDYGGWPEDVGEYPLDHVTDEHREVMTEMCSRVKKPNMPSLPSVPPSPEVAGAADLHVTTGGDAAGVPLTAGWDLRHVYSADEIRARAAECMGKDGGCGNVACSRYVNTLDKDDVWDTCIDCQEE